MALLTELEASLGASQAALLSRDLARFEQRVHEQSEMRRALATFFSPAHSEGSRDEEISSATGSGALRAAAARVLQLGRMQVAWLARAQQSLRAIAHGLAGTQAGYGPAASAKAGGMGTHLERSREG